MQLRPACSGNAQGYTPLAGRSSEGSSGLNGRNFSSCPALLQPDKKIGSGCLYLLCLTPVFVSGPGARILPTSGFGKGSSPFGSATMDLNLLQLRKVLQQMTCLVLFCSTLPFSGILGVLPLLFVFSVLHTTCQAPVGPALLPARHCLRVLTSGQALGFVARGLRVLCAGPTVSWLPSSAGMPRRIN